MMKKENILITICIIMLNAIGTKSQTLQSDVIKVMTYNAGSYGKTATGQCPLLNLTYKNAYLKTILEYEQPDILGLEKMQAVPYNDTIGIISNVLDSVCNGCWGHSTYSDAGGDSKASMLYFNTNRFGFVSTTPVVNNDGNMDDVMLTRLYYKSDNLYSTHDTIFLNILLVHFYAGSSNATVRDSEAVHVMNWLNAHFTSPENIMVMGDFNTQASSEGCFNTFINSSNNNTLFFDPPNQLGAWSSFSTQFANYLTQSTRTVDPGDCNSTGPMANRFDHILVTGTIMNGTDSVKYIPGSFTVIGQDGQHTGTDLLAPPVNNSVPGNVDSALYYMSEHLPVYVKLGFTYTVFAGIENISNPQIKIDYTTMVTDKISIQSAANTALSSKYNDCRAEIYDMQGRIVSVNSINLNQANTIDVTEVSAGMYFIRIVKDTTPVFTGKLIKIRN
jgi:hypothetical protein